MSYLMCQNNNTIYKLPVNGGEQLKIGELVGASKALECANIAEKHSGPVLIVISHIQAAIKLGKEICQFTDLPVINFPDWEILPYDTFSPHHDIISTRLSILYHINTMSRGILIIPVTTLMQRVCPKTFLRYPSSIVIFKGESLSKDVLCNKLLYSGYRCVELVMKHGEYAVRGSLIDLYPMGSNTPYRIDFSDNIINNLRLFNIENQRTLETIDRINLLPAREFPTNKEAIELFRKRWRTTLNIKRDAEHIYYQVSKGILPPGIEYWQPLFFEKNLSSLFSYLPSSTLIIKNDNLQVHSELFWKNINTRFREEFKNPIRPLLKPSILWLDPNLLFKKLKSWPCIQFSDEKLPAHITNINLGYQKLPDITLQSNFNKPLELLYEFLKKFNGYVIFSVKRESQIESLQKILASIKIYPKKIKCFQEYLKQDYSLMIGDCENGFLNMQRRYIFICERDLIKKHTSKYNDNISCSTINSELLVRNLDDLHPGQAVVHLDHGVGRYVGLIPLNIGGIEAEYLMLSYADDAKLYLPVTSLHRINRYSGSNENNVPLHKLGSDAWFRTRQKAAKKIRDIVAELLDIYAQRTMKVGFVFKKNCELYNKFCEDFPFETTPDQEKAINAVINDMCKPIAMDRLICGDVGFGKTEVAMRAAFISIENNKQVAVLVPTTLLAQQHYNNFRDRFDNWPVCIEMLSRFRSIKEQNRLLKMVGEGKINILISTHKLLTGNVQWYDLGLLIIDEEHRFGVRHKERIKAVHSEVDILTLTATPIPRTLNMAISGIRDLSIIATPPARRLSVKTFVREYDHSIVREAILREALRGGQIYYVYNDIDNIQNIAIQLNKLVPEVDIAVGHGQMPERDLQRIMNDFYHHRFTMLVCTTIIETGIDVPNANTIIIEKADQFGMAQLHQLRGRVGRSHHQAYAWLLISCRKTITVHAKKRLDAISSLEDLGAGFALAMHDLEIRGAGELLGEEQSGQMETIGFNLYLEMLENAVEALKTGCEPSMEQLTSKQPDIEMHISALLPNDFISDANTRLSFYKRAASLNNVNELTDLKMEIFDRFGNLPQLAINFLEISELRILARKIGIRKIEVKEKVGIIEFVSESKVPYDCIIKILQNDPQNWKIDGPTRFKFNINLPDHKLKIEWVKQFMLTILKA